MHRIIPNHFVTIPTLLVVALSFVLTACGSNPPGPHRPYPPDSPEGLYRTAVADAETADADEVVDNLVALDPSNIALSWRTDEDDDLWVKVVTWTSWEGYRDQIGELKPLGVDVWVTVVPEVKSQCYISELEGDQLNRRLEQYLGLPPEGAKPYFAIMWVRVRDVVRPCPDPSVINTTCRHDQEPIDVRYGNHDHRAWFEDLRSRSYDLDEGYPWTRLGYTYDWHPETDEQGASEFLLPEGTSVEVESVVTTNDYCNLRHTALPPQARTAVALHAAQ